MLLMEDYQGFAPKLDEERVNGAKKYYMRGVFAKAEFLNENKRVYPKRVLLKAMNEVLPIVEAGRMVGEPDHPPSPKVNVDRISHKITKLSFNDKGEMIGEAEVLDTYAGVNLQNLFKGGVNLGISSRGYGTVSPKSNGINEVNDDYKLVTFDVVVNPSAHAYPNAVYENFNFDETEVWNIDKIVTELFGK